MGRSQDYRTRSFLLTNREYSDFVLRLEFNLDQGTGSAVSVRAMPDEEMPYADGSRAYDHPMLKLIGSPERREGKRRDLRIWGHARARTWAEFT